MTEKSEQAQTGAIELSEDDLGAVQGGYANLEVSHLKSKKGPAPTSESLVRRDLTSGRAKSFQDGEDKF